MRNLLLNSVFKMLMCIASALLVVRAQQLMSPCPDVLQYEPFNPQETNQWHAKINLTSPFDLNGIWLDIELNKKAEILGNWFGPVRTTDNINYEISNRKKKLEAGTSIIFKFFVKYNVIEPIPTILSINLNGQTICRARRRTETTTTTEATTTSTTRRTTSTTTTTTRRPSSTSTTTEEIKIPNYPIQLTRSHPESSYECGTVEIPNTGRINQGMKTYPGQFPWHAAIYRSFHGEVPYICGGSLITLSYVLTAAHCVTVKKATQTINPKTLMVYLGKHLLQELDYETTQLFFIKNVYTPSDYDPDTYLNDIALMELNKNADITKWVRPVCLWTEIDDISNVDSRVGTVAGWGYDKQGYLTPDLRQAKMPVVDNLICTWSNLDFYSKYTSNKTYCAGFLNGTSVCNGDSGGGMVFPIRGTNPVAWQLRGLVSNSYSLTNEQNVKVCDPTQYVIFTDVAKHRDWIDSIIFGINETVTYSEK